MPAATTTQQKDEDGQRPQQRTQEGAHVQFDVRCWRGEAVGHHENSGSPSGAMIRPYGNHPVNSFAEAVNHALTLLNQLLNSTFTAPAAPRFYRPLTITAE